jgi:hypothetical protein
MGRKTVEQEEKQAMDELALLKEVQELLPAPEPVKAFEISYKTATVFEVLENDVTEFTRKKDKAKFEVSKLLVQSMSNGWIGRIEGHVVADSPYIVAYDIYRNKEGFWKYQTVKPLQDKVSALKELLSALKAGKGKEVDEPAA